MEYFPNLICLKPTQNIGRIHLAYRSPIQQADELLNGPRRDFARVRQYFVSETFSSKEKLTEILTQLEKYTKFAEVFK